MVVLFLFVIAGFSLTAGEYVCHEPFGCFSDEAPFHHYLMSNPKHPRDVGTSFTFHSPRRRRHFKDFSNRTLRAVSRLLRNKNLKVIVHGALESSDKTWVRDMTKGLLDKGNSDVIVMDYGEGATGLKAPGNARLVGAQLAYLLKYILKGRKIQDRYVHIIGFSLGAHVAGYAGTRVKTDGYKLGRITGLDPGDLPYGTRIYEGAHPFVRLDRTDADFVDVIHTDIKGLGIDAPIGHLDFFPNGGATQPGCGVVHFFNEIGNIRSREKFFQTVGCHHIRAVQYFIESLSATSCNFTAFPCESFEALKDGRCGKTCGKGGCPVMGYNAMEYREMSHLKGKKLYLQTNSKAPFCNSKVEVAKTSIFQAFFEKLFSASPW